MPKNKSPDRGLVCWIPTPDDYHFIPTRHLNPDYVAGVPAFRKQVQRNAARHAFEKRLEAGEHLYPQPQQPKKLRSFGITDRGMFNFGYVSFDRVPRERPTGIARGCHVHNLANIYPDDELIIDLCARVDPKGFNSCTLNIIL